MKNLKLKKQKPVIQNLDIQNDNSGSDDDIGAPSLMPSWSDESFAHKRDVVRSATSFVNCDAKLCTIVIESFKAQARVNAKKHIIPSEDADKIMQALDKIKKMVVQGKIVLDSERHADIYDTLIDKIKEMTNERIASLVMISGSKADQASGDLQSWVKNAYDTLDNALQDMQSVLLDKAEETVKIIMPGTSNSQVTQPVSFGHHLMSYVECSARDRDRIKDARKRIIESHYCSGALAGTSFPVNRNSVAKLLGFSEVSKNSIDSVSNRDCFTEFVGCISIIATNLSRVAQDFINMHAQSMLIFSDDIVSQHPLMPYRRDPEALEVVRGRAGAAYGSLISALTTLKGLPTEYCKDIHMIARNITNIHEETISSIEIVSAFARDAILNRRKMKEIASKNFSTSIDLYEWLITNASLSPEDAKQKTREIICHAISKGKKLSLLTVPEMQTIEPKITEDVYSALISSRAMISRRSGNGTNPVQVRKAIRVARRASL